VGTASVRVASIWTCSFWASRRSDSDHSGSASQRAIVGFEVLSILAASLNRLSSLKTSRVIDCRSTSAEPSKDPIDSGSEIAKQMVWTSVSASCVGAF